MTQPRGEWGRKIETILGGFDFDRCVLYLRATRWQADRSPGTQALLFPGETELRRLAGKLLRTVADDPDPVSHATAAGMVALKSDDELHLYFAIEARAA
jgi:hypothetical protein